MSSDILVICTGRLEPCGSSVYDRLIKSYDSNVRFISMASVRDRYFLPNKYTFRCKDVFPLQIGGNDIGSALSPSWGSLLLCQRTGRVGKQDLTLTVRNLFGNQLLSSLTLNQLFAFSLRIILGPCAISWCKYVAFLSFHISSDSVLLLITVLQIV